MVLGKVAYHEHDVVEDISKATDILGGDTSLVVPGEDRSGGSDVVVFTLGVLANLLEEFEKVGGIILVDDVTSETLAVGVLPAEFRQSQSSSCLGIIDLLNIKAFEAILLNKVDDILDEIGAVLGTVDVARQESASSPTTNRDKRLDVLEEH